MEDFDDDSSSGARKKRFYAFDCPTCGSNNPMDDGFRAGDELRCFGCSLDFLASVTEEGSLRLREI